MGDPLKDIRRYLGCKEFESGSKKKKLDEGKERKRLKRDSGSDVSLEERYKIVKKKKKLSKKKHKSKKQRRSRVSSASSEVSISY